MKSKILIAVLMLCIIVGGLIGLGVVGHAAPTVEDALGLVNIFNGGYDMNYLAMNGAVRNQTYTYFMFRSGDGSIKEVPAYCVNPTTQGVPQAVGVGESIQYLADRAGNDPKVVGIISNGYPHRSLEELQLDNKYQAYYATKMALWSYLIDDWNIGGLSVNPSLTGHERAIGEKILRATIDIYNRGIGWVSIPQPNITALPDKEQAYPVTIDGVDYLQQVFTLDSNTWVTNYEINIKFADESKVPAGTRIVDMDNKDIDIVITADNGGTFGGQFKVLYPADSVDGNTGAVQLNFDAEVYQYAVYYAVCAETDTYGNLQNYMCDTDPTTELRLSTFSNFADNETIPPVDPETPTEPEQPTTETQLIINKVQEGTNIPLAGARFEVKTPEGTVMGTFVTDSKGKITIPCTLSGQYVISELSAPEWHLLGEDTSQTVNVRYGNTSSVTFSNQPYGSLRVIKTDSINGNTLAGATIEITHIESNATHTAITDVAGAAYFDKLLPGAYQIKEIAAPDGYIMDEQTHTINVIFGDEVSFTFKNDPKPGLLIRKYDEANRTLLKGVAFEIYHDTVLLGTYLTDELGEISLFDLAPGTYLVKEVSADPNYVLNSTPQQIELTADGGIAELAFFNSLKPGIHIVKVDSVTFAPLPNVTFKISQVGGSFSKEYITDENGEISLTALDPSAYIIEEITSPDGYIIDHSSRIIQINGGENARFVFTNTPKPAIEIRKISSDGSPLAGVAFRIARIEDGSHYLDRITDNNGLINLSDLEPGVYSVQETSTTDNHILDPKEYLVELFPGKTSTLVIENQKRPNLIVYKHDADTGAPIANTVFTVRLADGSTVQEINTDSSGKAELKNLLPGVYEVVEKSVPEPYLLDAPSQLITLYPNRDNTIYFENHQAPSLTVKKVDVITGEAIQGAKFSVEFASNKTNSGEKRDLGIFTSDENGIFQLTNIEDGWYTITETEPAPGYALPQNPSQEIYLKSGENRVITFENQPLNAIVVWKYDKTTGQAVEGVTFQIKYLNGTSGTGGTVIGTYKTKANGSFTVTGLDAGTYIVEEIAVPDGYVLDSEPQTVYLSGEEQDVVQVYFGNSPKGSLLIKKVDASTNKPISDVEFMVTTSTGEVVGNNNGKFITDSAGTILIDGLAPGETLVVKETRAKDGYLLDNTPQTIKIKAGEMVVLEFRNQPTGNLIIKKLDSDSKEPLEGVTFEITYSDGSFVDAEGGKLSSKGLYYTDEDGQIILSHLHGTVIVTEIETIDGYVIDEVNRSQTVVINPDDTQTLTFYNERVTNITIRKVDDLTGEGLYGAVFVLYDDDGDTIGEYTSDNRGYVYIEGIDDGRYKIREIQAPEGYLLDEEYKTINVRYGKSNEIIWENTAQRGQIQIIKRSADYNSTNGLPAGALLSGAVFEIYDRAGNLKDTIVTGENGLAVSKLLPLGHYTVREIQAPNNYSIDEESFSAWLDFPGQIARYEVENSSLNIGIGINKTGPVEVMSNQPVKYSFSGIANNSNVRLDNFYWKDIMPWEVELIGIDTGTYNFPGSYKIMYRVNDGDYRILADNLSTMQNYNLVANPTALGLGTNERVTEIMFVFGQAPAGFSHVQAPAIHGISRPGLLGGTSFVNIAEVGGLHGDKWVQNVSRWVTSVYALPIALPRTGY